MPVLTDSPTLAVWFVFTRAFIKSLHELLYTLDLFMRRFFVVPFVNTNIISELKINFRNYTDEILGNMLWYGEKIAGSSWLWDLKKN